MHTQDGSTTPVDKTQQLQRKLYVAAKGSRNRRFHALYDRIFQPDILWRAWEEVRQNAGSAGSDGLSITDIEQAGVAVFLAEIEQELKANTYRPQPVLRVYIPKVRFVLPKCDARCKDGRQEGDSFLPDNCIIDVGCNSPPL